MEPLAAENEDTASQKGYGTYNDIISPMSEEQGEKENEEPAKKSVQNTGMHQGL